MSGFSSEYSKECLRTTKEAIRTFSSRRPIPEYIKVLEEPRSTRHREERLEIIGSIDARINMRKREEIMELKEIAHRVSGSFIQNYVKVIIEVNEIERLNGEFMNVVNMDSSRLSSYLGQLRVQIGKLRQLEAKLDKMRTQYESFEIEWGEELTSLLLTKKWKHAVVLVKKLPEIDASVKRLLKIARKFESTERVISDWQNALDHDRIQHNFDLRRRLGQPRRKLGELRRLLNQYREVAQQEHNPWRQRVRDITIVLQKLEVQAGGDVFCQICLTRKNDATFECGHSVCGSCESQLRAVPNPACPFCRNQIN